MKVCKLYKNTYVSKTIPLPKRTTLLYYHLFRQLKKEGKVLLLKWGECITIRLNLHV